ncbi:hypothetical protein CPC08DRAFT_713995 [Agrocybe pediades]|nr:hypothetical protein CPC08DRAFT_713995 [Agrocybe pediades]
MVQALMDSASMFVCSAKKPHIVGPTTPAMDAASAHKPQEKAERRVFESGAVGWQMYSKTHEVRWLEEGYLQRDCS